jgi:ABC-type transport system involved in cytochrome c biogenesis ATPase subunit
MTTEYPRGSEWRKCDLHVHTPFSIETSYNSEKEKNNCCLLHGLNNSTSVWDTFIADLEKNYEVGSIIGICDYNTFEGYLKIKKDYPNLLEKYTILPVIELRTDDYVGKKAELKINLHMIFSDKIDDAELNRLLDYPLTRDEIKIKDIKNFNSETICIEKLKKFLNENAKYYKNKYLLMLGRNEAQEIDNEIKGSYMKDAQFVCSASETVDQAKKAQSDTQRYFDEYNIKYIHCSDAHSFSSKKDEITRKIGHCYTWIKGIPSFETLRQAFFSYDSRVRIQSTKPVQPLNVIEDLEINLPAGTKIGDNDCCFAGEKYSLKLNPSLNCFIGGRGTGKSLLLQLMCSKNDSQLPAADNKNNIVSKIKNMQNWHDAVTIDGIEFEYFGQGTIEKFYESKIKFQESISNRLNKFWMTEEFSTETISPTSKLFINAINEKKEPLKEIINELEKQIKIVSSKRDNDKQIEILTKEIESKKKIVDAYKDEYYTKLSLENKTLTEKNQFLTTSKINLSNLLNNIKSLCSDLREIDEEDKYKDIFYYAKQYNLIIHELLKLTKDIENSEEKESCDKKGVEILTSLKISEDNIKQYFLERGMSKANVDDLSKAQQDLLNLNTNLLNLKNSNSIEEKEFSDLKSSLETAKTEYISVMQTILTKTKNVLESKGNKEISNLAFNYKNDKTRMFSDFAKFIKNEIGINESDFQAVLRKDANVNECDIVFSDRLKYICENEAKTMKSSEKILTYFSSNERNAKLYDLNCLLYMNNIFQYEIFNTMYQGKNLEDLSFGQRATAIVLTLLLFGNKPLIIDEPETHLDQRFVANDLVNIIKEVKNDKQIIFATHNANIVINADAEQIFILKMEDNNKTTISQMTIEDVYDQQKKEELLLLEGSLQAFKKREEKYVI